MILIEFKNKIRDQIEELEEYVNDGESRSDQSQRLDTLKDVLEDLDSIELNNSDSSKQSNITNNHIQAILDLINKKDYYFFRLVTPGSGIVAVLSKQESILCTGTQTEVFNYVLGFLQALSGFGK